MRSLIRIAVLTVTLAILLPFSDARAGIQLRIPDEVLQRLLGYVSDYLPLKFQYDIRLPQDYDLPIRMPDLLTILANKLVFTNIEYDIIAFDFTGIRTELSTFNYNHVIKLHIPVIEEWRIKADYKFNWMFIIPESGTLEFKIKNFSIDTAVNFDQASGSISPMIYYINLEYEKKDISFTEARQTNAFDWSFLTGNTDNAWTSMLNTAFDLGFNLVQGGVNMVAWPILQIAVGPIVEFILSNYQYQFSLGQSQNVAHPMFSSDLFRFDYELVKKPYIQDGHFIDLFFLGELVRLGKDCLLPQDQDHEFNTEEKYKDYMQIIVTQRAANCALQALLGSKLKTISISSDTIAEMFGGDNVEIDVNSIIQFIPQFKEKYPNSEQTLNIYIIAKEMEFKLQQKDFSSDEQSEAQITFDSKINFEVSPTDVAKVDFGDVMGTTFSFDFDVYNQTVFLSVKEWEIDDEVEKDEDAVIDTIGVSEEDYEEFWDSLQFMMTFLRRYVNRLIFNDGFPIPLTDSFFFDSKIFVSSDSILILVDPYIMEKEIMDQIVALFTSVG